MKWIYDLVELLFPRQCLVCGEPLSREEKELCLNCLVGLPLISDEQRAELEKVFRGIIEVEQIASYMYYRKGSPYNRLLYQIKYKNHPEVGTRLARNAAIELKPTGFFDAIDTIIPLPLSRKKERQRGYNQCDYIAQGLSEITGIPVTKNCITRTRSNETQTHKSREERWKNVEGIFILNNPENIRGKHVLLIDDVLTTGATLASCASPLLEAGCKVSIFTLACSNNSF